MNKKDFNCYFMLLPACSMVLKSFVLLWFNVFFILYCFALFFAFSVGFVLLFLKLLQLFLCLYVSADGMKAMDLN